MTSHNTDNRSIAGPSSGPFQGAIGTDAKCSTFTDASGSAVVINYITNNVQAETSLFQTLVACITPGAAYDSSQREYAPCCQPETRSAILSKIREWACANVSSRPIFWLSGPGGSGKSAIAQTFAKECNVKNMLAGSYFFLRGDKFRSSHKNFFFTLAYQLAISVPSMRALMQDALVKDSSIPSKALEYQFQMLIYDPILSLKHITPMVVVVDALDECDDTEGVLKVVSIISKACCNFSFPLRFLFASRAYEHISSEFKGPATEPLTTLAKLEDSDANGDIRRVLRDGFRQIRLRKQRVMKHLPEPWPSDPDLDLAVAKSEGLFIWAETVLKYVGSKPGLPHEKLKSALKLHPGLDSMYRQVMEDAPREDPFDSVVGAISLLRIRLSAPRLAQVLQVPVDKMLNALQGLEPILDIPEDPQSGELLQPYHASFHDFLMDRDRSENFYIYPAKQHFFIASSCLRIITEGGVTDKEVTDYACTNLFHHCRYALTQEGMVNPPPWRSNDLRHNWSRFGGQSFNPWFQVLLQREKLSDSGRDLDVVISKLGELPQRPRKLVRTLKRIQQHMLTEAKKQKRKLKLEQEGQEQRREDLERRELLRREERIEIERQELLQERQLDEDEELRRLRREERLIELQRQGERLLEEQRQLDIRLREQQRLEQEIHLFIDQTKMQMLVPIITVAHDLFHMLYSKYHTSR